MVIDVHAHLYPLPLVRALELGMGEGVVEVDGTGSAKQLIVRKHRFVQLDPPFYDSATRLEMMDTAGVHTQLLSLPPPMLHWASPGRALELARIVNDALAEIAATSRGRFVACAALPLQDPEASAGELRRAVTELGHQAVLLPSCVNAVELDDPVLEPVYAEIERLGVPVFDHPIVHAGLDCLRRHRLDVSLGFTLETSHAASRLILGGVLDRHPGLRICWSHLGGGLPFLADRVAYLAAHGREGFPGIGGETSRPFESYLRNFWYDSIVYSERNLVFGTAFAGSDRVMFGTDTPFFNDMTGELLKIVTSSALADEEKEAILHRNAVEFLGLDPGAHH